MLKINSRFVVLRILPSTHKIFVWVPDSKHQRILLNGYEELCISPLHG